MKAALLNWSRCCFSKGNRDPQTGSHFYNGLFEKESAEEIIVAIKNILDRSVMRSPSAGDSLTPVPTPENLEGHMKLVAARERLAGITRQLTEANATMFTSGNARRRYEEIQKEWEQAFTEFKAAAAAFSIATLAESNRFKLAPGG